MLSWAAQEDAKKYQNEDETVKITKMPNGKLPGELIVKANCMYPWTISWTSAIIQRQVLL